MRDAIGPQCAADWETVTAAFERALQVGGSAAVSARALFGLRAEFLATDLYYLIADAASMATQYGHKRSLCASLASITARSKDANETRAAFAAWVRTFWGAAFARGCFYDSECLRDASRAAEWQPTSRAWRWQKCNEVAYLQPAPSRMPLRSRHLTLRALTAQCAHIFGGAPSPYAGPAAGARAALQTYGGAAHLNASRIFFSDFSDDPWQRASVRRTLSPELPYSYVRCEGCGHCMDLHAANATTDPPQLRDSRARFEKLLTEWLR